MRTREEIDKLWRNPKYWWGPIYNCPDDPRIIVPLRIRWTGAGMSFAHAAAIPVLIATLVALLAPFLFLMFMELPEGGVWTVASFTVVTVVLCLVTRWEANRPR